jgi:hypothetical protein
MRADIHDGQEQKRSIQGPDTEAQDLSSPDHHIRLATHGRSIQMCQVRTLGASCQAQRNVKFRSAAPITRLSLS